MTVENTMRGAGFGLHESCGFIEWRKVMLTGVVMTASGYGERSIEGMTAPRADQWLFGLEDLEAEQARTYRPRGHDWVTLSQGLKWAKHVERITAKRWARYDLEAIAREFTAQLDFTPAEWREVKRRLKLPAYANCCPSHDFCDANMPMNDAFEKLGHSVFNEEGRLSVEIMTAWNAAWQRAREMWSGEA